MYVGRQKIGIIEDSKDAAAMGCTNWKEK